MSVRARGHGNDRPCRTESEQCRGERAQVGMMLMSSTMVVLWLLLSQMRLLRLLLCVHVALTRCALCAPPYSPLKRCGRGALPPGMPSCTVGLYAWFISCSKKEEEKKWLLVGARRIVSSAVVTAGRPVASCTCTVSCVPFAVLYAS